MKEEAANSDIRENGGVNQSCTLITGGTILSVVWRSSKKMGGYKSQVEIPSS